MKFLLNCLPTREFLQRHFPIRNKKCYLGNVVESSLHLFFSVTMHTFFGLVTLWDCYLIEMTGIVFEIFACSSLHLSYLDHLHVSLVTKKL